MAFFGEINIRRQWPKLNNLEIRELKDRNKYSLSIELFYFTSKINIWEIIISSNTLQAKYFVQVYIHLRVDLAFYSITRIANLYDSEFLT